MSLKKGIETAVEAAVASLHELAKRLTPKSRSPKWRRICRR